MGVSDEKRSELQEAILNLFRIKTKLPPFEALYLSALVVGEVINEGWRWYPPKVEDLWKDLPTSDYEYHAYEINALGVIRHRETKEVVQPIWDDQWQRFCVKLTKNDNDWVKLDGPELAKDLFGKRNEIKLVDVNSLYPEAYRLEVIRQERESLGYPTTNDKEPPVEPTWVRIPNFKNYEVNEQGIVRNFWTKRELGDYAKDPNKLVELHGKDGSPFVMSLKAIMKETFGE